MIPIYANNVITIPVTASAAALGGKESILSVWNETFLNLYNKHSDHDVLESVPKDYSSTNH